MLTEKIRVAVLLGGASNEKETSLDSGRNVFYKLSPHKYHAIALFVSSSLELYKLTQSQLVRNSTQEIKWSDLPTIADFVFNALHGGEGENGSVQGALEMLGLPYNGSSVLASALCMNKYKTNQLLAMNGFDVPRHIYVTKQDPSIHSPSPLATANTQGEREDNISKDEDSISSSLFKFAPSPFALSVLRSFLAEKNVSKGSKLENPLIVKPHDDGCSVMVQKANTPDELIAAIEKVLENKDAVLIEECIIGMELTVGVIGNDVARALPPSQAISAHGILSIEEKFLPGAGENQTPAPLPHTALRFVQDTMERAYTTLQCKGYVRIDCFYQSAEISPTGKERVVILEINTLPGLTPATCLFHQAAEIGLKPMEFIDLIITLGFEEHKPDFKHKDLFPHAALLEKNYKEMNG
jgi:D-alanine-D-alanine ligase